MKKVFILGFALLLFSCSQEDPAPLNSSESKDVSTIDPLIGFTSPYNDVGTGLETDMVEYLFNNETDFTFKIKPFFGLAFYDADDDTGNFHYRGFPSMADSTKSLSYSPHLIANGKQYGNFMQSDYLNPITLVNTTKSLICTALPFLITVPVSMYTGEPEGFDFSQGNPDGVATTQGEIFRLASFGKLYYAEVEVYKNGVLIFETYLKADFPLVNSSSIYSNTGNWRTLYNDSFFGEKMVYNIHTSEICIPNTEESIYTSTEIFDYGAKTYRVGMASTTSKIEVYLKEI